MKVGVLVRANRKGLGYQTRDFMDNFPADVAVLLKIPDRRAPDDLSLVAHREMFEIDVAPDFKLPPKIMAGVFREIDVLFSAETLYDWSITDLAHRYGARTVVHGNPEFYVHHHRPYQQPDRWIWPSPWLTNHPDLPVAPVIPCPAPPWEPVAGHHDDEVLRVLHVAGHSAAADRNGTTDFVGAIPRLRYPVEVTIVSQDGWLPDVRAPKHVKVNRVMTGIADRRAMYEGQHLVVLPRRYGGNCLPAAEACAAGCALAMTDTAPNEMWPIVLLAARAAPGHHTPFGRIKTVGVRSSTIADVIDRLNANRSKLAEHQARSLLWAANNSWDALRPVYRKALS